ncbi:copper resistance protein B [Tautonia sociabilis]|uniref:Copper resistance protein B n=1 Tax=Tautonia sociabilis TaxID=2080755 RepID=A0A432MIP2_9BACT|nr:copper resistance protein B [Tautonia sociabilis]
MDDQRWYRYLLLEPFEYQLRDGDDTFSWEADGWVGGDDERLWLKTEGDLAEDEGEAEAQLLYSRLIAPFWDLQLGVRYDQPWGSDADSSRAFAVVGLEGLAPYYFDIEPALFLSDDADVSARLEATFDLLLAQRLVLQPRLELDAAVQEVPEHGVGQGLNDFELGARLRYELRREFAPYVGVSWTRKTGETAGIARRDGEEVSDFAVIFGVRMWF